MAGSPTERRTRFEILEFRRATGFDMEISESPARWRAILDGARTHADAWADEAPANQ